MRNAFYFMALASAAQPHVTDLPIRTTTGYRTICASGDVISQLQCLAYTQGVIDGIGTGAVATRLRLKDPLPEEICVPAHEPLASITAGIIKFIDGHTDILIKSDSSTTILEALKDRYPCSTK